MNMGTRVPSWVVVVVVVCGVWCVCVAAVVVVVCGVWSVCVAVVMVVVHGA